MTKPEPIIETVSVISLPAVLLALAFGIAAGVAIVAIIGREREIE